jgi:hypothetical protein
MLSRNGKQPGDPVCAAKAIVEAVHSSDPPLRLVLGRMALETVRGKLELLRQDFDAWEKSIAQRRFSRIAAEQRALC